MTISEPAGQVIVADWSEHADTLFAIRRQVFIVEQNVPEELEHDQHDATAVHVLITDTDGRGIATGRLLPDGHIGRVAVLAEYRGSGIGRQVMIALHQIARERGHTQIILNSQLSALPFYRRLGYRAEGPEFIEAGIRHRRMRLQLE